MQEPVLRKAHRYLGVAAAPLVVLQAVSGLFLSVDLFSRFQGQVRSFLADRELTAAIRLWDYILADIHFGGGRFGTLHNVVVAASLLLLVGTGLLVFAKVVARTMGRCGPSPAAAGEQAPEPVVGAETFPAWFGRRQIGALVALTVIGVLGAMVYAFHDAYRMIALHSPLVHAVGRVQLEATRSHLWLEEVLSGDPDAGIGPAWRALEAADAYAEAVLVGAEAPEATYLPLEDRPLRRRMEGIRTGLGNLKDLTVRRYVAGAGPGTPEEAEYDRLFEGFSDSTGEIGRTLLGMIARDRELFLVACLLIASGSFLLLVLVGTIFYRYEANQSRHLALVEQEKERAERGRQLLRQMIQQAADCFLVFEPGGRVVDANRVACAWFGYSRDELLSSSVLSLTTGGDGEDMLRFWNRMEPAAPASFRCRFRKRDGSALTMVANIGVLRWKEDTFLLCLAREEGAR